MDVAAGMDYLHSLGVLHSDLKAANVLLTSKQPSNYDPRGFVCKVTDFGLSRRAPAPRPIYAAPCHPTPFLPVFLSPGVFWCVWQLIHAYKAAVQAKQWEVAERLNLS